MVDFKEMQKNPEENFTTVEVDPVTGEYYVTIPEWILNEYGWYEGTEVNMEVEGDCIIITDIKKDWHRIDNTVWYLLYVQTEVITLYYG